MFGLSLIAPEFIVILIKEKWLTSAYLMQILCIGGAFLPIATLYFNMIISRGKSNIYMWNIITQCCTLLTAILCVKTLGGGVREMVISWVCITILWIAIWHYFVWREIQFSFIQALKDILPFMLIAAFSMLVTFLMTRHMENIYLLLIFRIIIASIIYFSVLCMLGAKILKECLGYLFRKKGGQE